MDGEPSSILAPTYRIFRDKHGIPQFSPKRGTQALLDAISYAFPNLETELQLMQAALRKFFDAERGSKFVFELRQNDLQISLTKPKAKDAKPFPSECSKDSLKNWKSRERGQRRGSRAGSRASSRPPSRPPSRALSRVSSRAGENPLTRPETPSDLNAGRMTTWVLSSGQELEGRKKAPYDPVKRRKVAENRGNVCEKHRVSKTMMSDFLRGFSRPFLANFRQCDPELCPDNKAYVKPVDVSKDIGDRGGFNSLPTVEETKMAQSGQVIPTEASATIPQSQPIENLPLQEDTFWDASTNPDLSFTDEESLWTDMSLTNSNSTSWTTFASDAESLLHPEPIIVNEVGDILISNHYSQQLPLPNENVPDFAVPPPGIQEKQAELSSSGSTSAQLSDDPFMGWTSRRGSQLCDDYGWVLSHVGTL